MPRPKSRYKNIPLEDLQKVVNSVTNWSDLLRHFDLRPGSGNHRGIKNYCSDNQIDYTHFSGNKEVLRKIAHRRMIPLSDILVECSNFRNTSHLKKRLLRETELQNKCSICSQEPFFNDKILVMVLDHINGDNRDNRIENLRLVCPNCNSQLDTSFGRNKSKR